MEHTDDLRCPHVKECAHPTGGKLTASGNCRDCGSRVVRTVRRSVSNLTAIHSAMFTYNGGWES